MRRISIIGLTMLVLVTSLLLVACGAGAVVPSTGTENSAESTPIPSDPNRPYNTPNLARINATDGPQFFNSFATW